MDTGVAQSPSKPAVVLGLTFLIIGLTFALPFRLVPGDGAGVAATSLSPETLNVYACTAWAGWAHFIYSFRGQGKAIRARQDSVRLRRLLLYIGLLAVTIAVLLGIRLAIGPAIFGALAWIYFIDHFVKAERAFEGRKSERTLVQRFFVNYQVLMTFAWLSFVLLNVGDVIHRPWLLWSGTLVFGLAVLLLGGWERLSQGDARGPLLALFFVGEAAVWGAVGQYAGAIFLTGVYVFHIAAGSYFHYLGSYFFAGSRGTRDGMLHPAVVIGLNLVVIALGYFVVRLESLAWLVPILGIQWFTLWVAVHLVASDFFPMVKKWEGAVRSGPGATPQID